MGTTLAPLLAVKESFEEWEGERRELLERRISEMGLSITGSLVERLVQQLYAEMGSRGMIFQPPVYLSDQWGCPDNTPLIGVPFYLADPKLARIEEEMAVEVEGEGDVMRYLRHEAGHAVNYAYRLYDRADWAATFGSYALPYRERFHADPFSRNFVRHILGWYAQKHPDEDFAETFAVWLTPDLDWRAEYAGWPALRKLEYMDRLMHEIAGQPTEVTTVSPDDLPVEAMHYTIADHYREASEALPIEDRRHFDGDLRNIFAFVKEAPEGESAARFLARHRREVIARIAYWTAESTTVVGSFIDFLTERCEELALRVRGLEASTIIELTAFGTAVMMRYRYARTKRVTRRQTETA